MKNDFFITTRNDGIYKFVTDICRKHFQKKNEKKIQLKKIELKYIFSLREFKILFFLKNIFNYSFYDDVQFIKKKHFGCEIGRHVLAATYNHLNSHTNKLSKNFFKIYYFIYGIILLEFLKKNNKHIKSAFIDHGVYINGIIINYLSSKNIIFYTNSYPYGLYFTKSNYKKLSYQDLIRIDYPKKKINTTTRVIKKNSFKWPWVFNKKFFNISRYELKNIDYIIYSHAFTDGLLANGYDGFIRMDEWLNFTIDKLLIRNKKILVKIHPNFHSYNKNFRSKYETIIFSKIKNKYSNNKNLKFIDYPSSNLQLLKKIDKKKTILITHHGTPILEGVANGFKIISSVKTHWDKKFKLSNTWSNKNEYKKILNKNFDDLKYGSLSDLKKLFSIIFENKFGVYSDKHFSKLLKYKNTEDTLRKIESYIVEN